MKISLIIANIIVLTTIGSASAAFAQAPTETRSQPAASTGEAGPIRSSAAYAEILLRKTELQAEIESVASEYTDENPRMLDLRFELAALERSLTRVFGVKPNDTGKLTQALGKLIVKKTSLETEQARLARRYDAEHPEIRRAKRRVEIFESAISEILK